jgi:hypothetical protein
VHVIMILYHSSGGIGDLILPAPKHCELEIKTRSFMTDSREHPYCSVYSRCYAAIVRWAVISHPFLGNGSVKLSRGNGVLSTRSASRSYKKRTGATSSVELCKGGWEEMAL